MDGRHWRRRPGSVLRFWMYPLVGLLALTMLVAAPARPAAAAPSFTDGTFVRVSDNGEVYRIAGGAPVYVDSWSRFGGEQPAVTISRATLNELPWVPADGTFLRSNWRGEVFRVAGGAPQYVSDWALFGGRQPVVDVTHRAIADAGAAGHWSHLRRFPAGGTVLRTLPDRRVWVVAGGAPVPSSEPAVSARAVDIDAWVVSSPGATGLFGHLARRPSTGTFLRAPGSGGDVVYRVVAGAPFYVADWAPFGGPQPAVPVDAAVIERAGQPNGFDHLVAHPEQGVFVRDRDTGRVYRVAGGAPLYVSTWAVFGAPQPVVDVDHRALQYAGSTGLWRALLDRPADGVYLRTKPDITVYRVAGGAPVVVTSWQALAHQGAPSTDVDQAAVERAGSGGPWDHLRFHPQDGTVLQAGEDGALYTVRDGAPRPGSGGGEPVVVDPVAIQRAGQPGPFAHLRSPS